MAIENIEFMTVEQRLLSGMTWTTIDRVVAGDQTLKAGTASYRPIAVGRGDFEASENEHREEVTVELPHDDAISQLMLPRFPDQPLRFTIYRATQIDRDPTQIEATEFHVVYIGTASGARFSGSMCEIMLQPRHAELKEVGPKQRFQRLCRWDLYGDGCGVDRAAHEISGTATVAAEPSDPLNYTDFVFSDAFSAGGLAGGTIVLRGQWVRQISFNETDGGAGHTPAKPYVRLVSPFPVEIEDGDSFQAYPGCDHTKSDCLNKFNNIANHGGLSRVAKDNPFRKGL